MFVRSGIWKPVFCLGEGAMHNARDFSLSTLASRFFGQGVITEGQLAKKPKNPLLVVTRAHFISNFSPSWCVDR